jgi:hypothetical protein
MSLFQFLFLLIKFLKLHNLKLGKVHTVFLIAFHWYLSWTEHIQPKTHNILLLQFISLLCSHLHLDIFLTGFLTKTLIYTSYLPHACCMSFTSHHLHLITLIIMNEQTKKLLTTKYSPSSCYILLPMSKHSPQYAVLNILKLLVAWQSMFHTIQYRRSFRAL